ncbi:MAG: dephospho-CoA kinase [Defluviitaleaceae bacterium]|nr:dephospho-CoA kinase [Defluviitaleaceae bacterium]
MTRSSRRGGRGALLRLAIIGVTGISGSGTSTVAQILAEQGGFVIHADKLAHEIMCESGPAFNEIVRAFGAEVLNTDGKIDRQALGAMVFGTENKEKLSILEKILHPRVESEIIALIEESAATGEYSFAVIDAPLLIESGLNNLCDACWLVTAPENTRLARIMARDSISREAALRRLQSRPGDETLRPYADAIIENDDDLKALCDKVFAEVNNVA